MAARLSRPDEGPPRRAWFRQLGAVGVFVAAVPWLVACQPVPLAPLTLGANPWVGYDPLVLARERGLLDPREVRLVELPSGSETLRHYRNGQLDAAAITLDEALRLADEGFAPRIVALVSASAGADVVLAAPHVRGLDDLRGRRVAVEATTVGALMLQRLLQAAGLQAADVVVSNVEATRHGALLRVGRVDVAISYEPLAGQLTERGARPIFDSREMPGDIVDVLVVSDAALRTRAPQVAALLRAWGQGLQALQQDPGGSAQLLAPGIDLRPDEYRAVAQGLRFFTLEESLALLRGSPPPQAEQSERLWRTLESMGLIRESPDWGRLLAPEPLRLLLQGGAS